MFFSRFDKRVLFQKRWNYRLEGLAQKWADRCKFEHPDTSKFPDYKGVGQNIAMSSGKPTMDGLAAAWYNEVKYYTYANNSCAPKKMCGHYTQVLPFNFLFTPLLFKTCLKNTFYVKMVWANTEKIGCAMTKCSGNYLLVCQYEPQYV